MEYLVCIFLVGAITLIQLAVNFIQLVRRLFLGTEVTTERYGAYSWAVVTGCTQGIGKQMALDLAKRGFNIVLIGRNIEKLRSVALEVQKQRQDCLTRALVFDFSKQTSPDLYRLHILDKIKDLDISILVNNVGTMETNLFINQTTQGVYDQVAVNCYPQVILSKLLLPLLQQRYKKTKIGSLIINLSSQVSYVPTPYSSVYSATKRFNDFFSEAVSYEFKKYHIDVLSVLPGAVETNLSKLNKALGQVITPKDCVKGILRNATSRWTAGGVLHEIHAFMGKNVLMKFTNVWMQMHIAYYVNKFLERKRKSFRKLK